MSERPFDQQQRIAAHMLEEVGGGLVTWSSGFEVCTSMCGEAQREGEYLRRSTQAGPVVERWHKTVIRLVGRSIDVDGITHTFMMEAVMATLFNVTPVPVANQMSFKTAMDRPEKCSSSIHAGKDGARMSSTIS